MLYLGINTTYLLIQILCHGFHHIIFLLIAVFVGEESYDVVYAPCAILAAEFKPLMYGLYLAPQAKIHQRRALLLVKLHKFQVAHLKSIRIIVLHLRPQVVVKESDFLSRFVLFLHFGHSFPPVFACKSGSSALAQAGIIIIAKIDSNIVLCFIMVL